MNNSQRKQVLVKLTNDKEGKEFISFLESRGLINIHNITFNKLTTKVLIVEDKKFFSANVTCLAIMARYGIKPISVNEFKTRLKNQTEMINNL